MSKLGLLKATVGLATSAGVSQIITGIVNNNTVRENSIQKGTIWVAKIGITTIVSEYLRAMTDTKIDNAVKWYDENITQELKKEQRGLSE